MKGLLAAAALALPALGLACPACAARDGERSARFYASLGTMILLPFAVSGTAIGLIRRVDRRDGTDVQTPEEK